MPFEELVALLGKGTLQTLYMVLASTALAYAIGLPLGVLLRVSDADGLRPMRVLHGALGFAVNLLRSVPFVILLVWMIPVTRFLVGTSIGSTATIVPLTVSAAPFVARMVESSLKEVSGGVMEASLSMGATPMQTVRKVLLAEARPSLLVGVSITMATVLGYTAMAGFVGGGGLGAIAVNYGYYRYQDDIMLLTVILLVLLVQILQEVGMRVAARSDRRNTKTTKKRRI